MQSQDGDQTLQERLRREAGRANVGVAPDEFIELASELAREFDASGANNSGPNFLASNEWDAISRALKLSSREREVLADMLSGANESEIAANLRIGKGTVHTYVKRLYGKLGVNSHGQAIVRAFAVYVALARVALQITLLEKDESRDS